MPATAPQPAKRTSVISLVLRVAVPLIVTVGLCRLLFTEVDFGSMMRIIKAHCSFSWIIGMWVLNVLAQVVRAMRWQIQLRALGVESSLFELTLSIFGTYAVNLVFPRLGEVWRTGWVARRAQAPFTTVFGSMVADRLADTIAVGLLALATLLVASAELGSFLSQNPDAAGALTAALSNPWVWTCLGVLLIGGWLLAARLRDSALAVRIKQLWGELWRGFRVIAVMPGRLRWLILTVALWALYFGGFILAMRSFAFTTQILHDDGMVAALVCFVLSSLSMAVPSNGGIGPWQWAVIFALNFYAAGVSLPAGETFGSMAASFANLVMAASTFLIIVLGLFTFVCVSFMDKEESPEPEDEYPE